MLEAAAAYSDSPVRWSTAFGDRRRPARDRPARRHLAGDPRARQRGRGPRDARGADHVAAAAAPGADGRAGARSAHAAGERRSMAMDAPRPVRVTPTSGCRWGPSRSPRARDARWQHTTWSWSAAARAARRWPRTSPAAVSAWRSSSARCFRASRSASRWCRRRCCCCERLGVLDVHRARRLPGQVRGDVSRSGERPRHLVLLPEGHAVAGVDVQRPARRVRHASCSSTRASRGSHVVQPATVQGAAFDADGVTVEVEADGERVTHRARFLVDASGRDSFLAGAPRPAHARAQSRQGGAVRVLPRRRSLPGPGRGQRPHLPLRRRLVLVDPALPRPDQHRRGPARPDRARVRRARPRRSTLQMVQRCHKVRDHLGPAERTTPVYRTANFAYTNAPVVGDRFLAVGDAVAFVDPIFSSGVFIAIRTGELAAEAIVKAFADGRFAARRFAGYERAVWRGVAPFFTFINKYYEPAFIDLFLKPKNIFGMVTAVLNVLSGGALHPEAMAGPRLAAAAVRPGPHQHLGASPPRPAGRVPTGVVAVLLRTLRGYAFTIAGIAIGVAGIVALGAMAERIVRFIEGGDRFVLGQISVAGRGMGMGTGFTAGGLLPASAIRAIAERARRRRRAVAGDAAAEPVHLAVHDADAGAGPRPRPRGADAQPPLSRVPRARRGGFCARGIAGWRWWARRSPPRTACGVGASLTLEGESVRAGRRPRADAHRARPLRHRADRGRARAVGGQGPAAPHRARLGRRWRCRRAISTPAPPSAGGTARTRTPWRAASPSACPA